MVSPNKSNTKLTQRVRTQFEGFKNDSCVWDIMEYLLHFFCTGDVNFQQWLKSYHPQSCLIAQ